MKDLLKGDNDISDLELSFDEFDELHSPRHEECDFDLIIEKSISRRGFMGGGLVFGSVTSLTSIGSFLASTEATQANTADFGFEAVAANTKDTVTVPDGYSWKMLIKWGDGLWSKSPEFDEQTRGTGASQELSFGDNNDGMALFERREKTIIAVNNEYNSERIIFGNRKSLMPETYDDIRKSKAAHGVSVFEISEKDDGWQVVIDSPYNRRITADTPMQLTGPAAGSKFLQTDADPTGEQSLGTWNNCGNGKTPWGTYLTCEENFNGYFSSLDKSFTPSEEMERYGVRNKGYRYRWALADERFDISKHPNECNRVGYVVEIDPLNPDSMPKKRTALGRFKHENAEVIIANDGRVVVYMGDDERNEFIYRYISDDIYIPGGDTSDLLNKGTLFAAYFDPDGSGEWRELTTQSTGMSSEAEICVYTRMAASAVGATTMDRPEYLALNPNKPEIYCALTKNPDRGVRPNKGGDPSPVEGPNPRAENWFGQIVRWRPVNGDHTSNTFEWDLYVLAGNPKLFNDARAGSENITEDNMFSSPNCLSFSPNGLIWIATDNTRFNKPDHQGIGNNQMLAGDPITGEIRRFLVGPVESEVTCMRWSTDQKTLFVGIQHPGEKQGSDFPNGFGSVPRSGIVAITRDDGGTIG